ncbi:MAG: DUF2939 domain-containing protein [Pseudomonadota bacterium]
MFRLIFLMLLVACVSAAAFVIAPLWTAADLMRAVKEGDRDVIARSIEWAPVRASLRTSLITYAQAEAAEKRERRRLATGRVVRAGFMDRFRARMTPYVIDRTIMPYVTARGLPRLYAMRSQLKRVRPRLNRMIARAAVRRRQPAYRPAATRANVTLQRAKVTDAPASSQMNLAGLSAYVLPEAWLTGLKKTYARVVQARFVSTDRFELVLKDQFEPGRKRIRSVFERRGLFTWKLTRLQIQPGWR